MQKYFTLYLTLVLPVINCGSLKELPTECFDATELQGVETRYFENLNIPTSKANDLNLKPGWYRVLGKGGNSLMQGYPKPLTKGGSEPNFCGTEYAGTLLGEHPTEEEGIVEMTVCFRERFCFIEGRNCECTPKNTVNVFVRNCRRHFIYWLSPTLGNQRYCTGFNALTGAEIKDGKSKAIECDQNKDLTELDRLWNEVSDVKCDEPIGEWYRFTQGGGEMASTCAINNKTVTRLGQPCGAEFRGWMVDRHPSLEQGRVQRRICFSYADHCRCDFFGKIAVRNCGSYYVYRLSKVPMCKARYCAAPENSKASQNDVGKPAVNSNKDDLCNQYRVLYDPDRLWSYTNPTIKKCDADLYGRFRFGSKYTQWSIKEGCNTTDMSTVTHRCGSQYQGFMEGQHPEVIDGYVERVVCFQKADIPCECQFTATVGVKNCGNYFVYDFRGVPQCSSRYCMVANKTTAIQIDPNLPPLYELRPPAYEPATEKVIKEDNEGGLVATTTILSIIVFIVLVVLILIVILLIFFVWPIYKERKEKPYRSQEEVTPAPINRSNDSPVVCYSSKNSSGSNGQLQQDEKVHDLEEPPIAPYPSVPPPNKAPQSAPPYRDDDDVIRATNKNDFKTPSHDDGNDDDSDGLNEFDTLVKKEDINKPKSYDSAV